MRYFILLFILHISVYCVAYQVECGAEFDSSKYIFSVDDDLNIVLSDSKCELTNIDDDDKVELFVYLEGMVNKCGYIYTYDENSTVYNKRFIPNEVCDYSVVENILISSFRDQGYWKYDYFSLVKKEKESNSSLEERIQSNVVTYNNIAYYLQKAGANEEAVYLLEKILKKYPNRTVAHYNIADAYWALGEKKKAVASYNTYIEQMCNAGKEKRIPQVVIDRASSK